ncbi:MAG TPA: MlaD family protein [Candidatus Binatia bacterium]|nr:MlaD family protein [Candidatus Binatia bacterium]
MAKQAKVGLLVLAALVVFMMTILTLGQQQHLFERKVTYEIHFARSNGLQQGALVSLSGVSVGSVSDMRFPADPAARYIQVTVEVNSDVAPRIRENTLASIRTFGLLGDRYVELTPGTTEAPALEPGGIIPSIDPIDYEALFGQSGDIVTNIAEVTAQLKDVLGSIQRGEGLLGAMLRNKEMGEQTLADLERTMANLQSTSQSLASILQRVDRGEGIVGHLVRNTPEGRRLLADAAHAARALDQLAGRLSRGTGALPRLFEDPRFGQRALGNLDAALADLAAIADKVNRGQGTLGRLVNDPRLYEEAEGFVGGARSSFLLRLLGLGGSKPAPPQAGSP